MPPAVNMVIVNAVVMGSLLVLIIGLVVVASDPDRRMVLRWIPIPYLRGMLRMLTLLVLGVIVAGLVSVMREYGNRVRVFGMKELSTDAVALITTALVLGAFVLIERWAEARTGKVLLLGLTWVSCCSWGLWSTWRCSSS
jgi:hypothetical protein